MDALPELWQERGFALYVHWPFCASKCPYCDFNSHVRTSVSQRDWANAYVREIHRIGQDYPDRVLTSVFFGGGTPSLMEPDTVAAILAAARDVWVFANDIEITLEANPTSVDASRFEGYVRHGVNRVSLGIQALNNRDLAKLGRLHSVEEALSALELARRIFARVSIDLIYARQDQTLSAWRDELSTALEFGLDHLSLYQLTIEQGTAFWSRQKTGGLKGLPDEDLAADMYELTQETCAGTGLPAYEISNHARRGEESRHNLVYWRGGDYAGVGPGAHGRLTAGGERRATECWASPEIWLDAVGRGSGDQAVESIDARQQCFERAIMGLRINEGVRKDDLGPCLDESGLIRCVDMGLLWQDDQYIGATSAGRPVLNRVIDALLVD